MHCPSCGAENHAAVEVCFGCGRHLTALTQGSLIASRYEIVSLLGKGGMGMVYRAHDRLLDEAVAIKVLRNEFVGTPEMAQRFRSEIKLARKVSHPNVCRIHEYGQDGGVSYISMALIEGTDLRSLLLHHPRGLPRDEAFHAAIQVADGLQAIHDVGIIHRDLKTPNVLVEPSGVLRLLDFGIAKESGGAAGLTATGEVMGTPEYMSPEQCRGHQLEFRSDIYSLGILIYEIFTGHVPFHGETLMATLLMQIQDAPPLDGPDAAAIPRGVVAILRKALAKDAAQRFSTAAEVAQALRQARQEPAEDERARPAGADVADRPAAPPNGERRLHSRLGISVDVVLQRMSAGGAVMQEERTVADNIGRKGARVMTAMTGLALGDLVALREVGSTFEARAAVRHVFRPVDNIQRLGLEFLDRAAPDRLVPTDSETQPRTPRATARPAPEAAAGYERRRGSRLDITMNVIVKRLGRGGETLQEERSVADNVGLRGARLMTTMTTVAPGELLFIEEVGSDFRTRAAVRSSYAGKDSIHRLGVEFLDCTAPAHLVARDDSQPRLPRVQTVRSEPVPEPHTTVPPPEAPSADRLRDRRGEIWEAYDGLKSRNHFEVLGIPRASNAAKVKEAYVRLTKQFHPDALLESGFDDLRQEAQAVFHAVAEAYEVLIDPQRRSAYETRLGPSRQTPRPVSAVSIPAAPAAPPAAEIAEPPRAPAPEPAPQLAPEKPPHVPPGAAELDPEVELRQADQIFGQARKQLAEGRYWDAIHGLEGAQDLARGSRTNHAVRVLLARATAKNPKWQRRAEAILLSVLKEDPGFVDAHLVLGKIYSEGGLKSRAEVQFRRVLDIYPTHREAAEELQALKKQAPGRA
jgi:hypothetical protein